MERIINNSILNYLLDHSLIINHQYGLIQKRSTCTNLLQSLHNWTLNLKLILVVVNDEHRRDRFSFSYQCKI